MGSSSFDGGKPSNIHFLQARKPRYSAQDLEELDDARRLVRLQNAEKHLGRMHGDLHDLFAEAVKAEDEWPFMLVRHLQSYVDKSEFDMMTRNPDMLSAARQSLRATRDHNLAKLGAALLQETRQSLRDAGGAVLRADPKLMRNLMSTLHLTQEIIAPGKTDAAAKVGQAASTAAHTLVAMFDSGENLPDTGRAALNLIEATPSLLTFENDATQITPRRRHLRLSEHWLRVSMDELELMKINLIADHQDKQRGARTAEADFAGISLRVTEPQKDFIEADAHSQHHLRRAAATLYQALVH